MRMATDQPSRRSDEMENLASLTVKEWNAVFEPQRIGVVIDGLQAEACFIERPSPHGDTALAGPVARCPSRDRLYPRTTDRIVGHAACGMVRHLGIERPPGDVGKFWTVTASASPVKGWRTGRTRSA